MWSSVYELPFGKGKPYASSGVLEKIVGGWNLSNFIEFRSGAPFSINSLVNTCNCFSQGNQGVDLTGTPKKDTGGFDPGSDTFFNTTAFAFALPLRFGNAGAGILEAPGYASVDTTLAKRIPFNERFSLDLRVEFFNMLNRVNFNQPDATFGSPTFGRVTSTLDARRLQLGAKLYF